MSAAWPALFLVALFLIFSHSAHAALMLNEVPSHSLGREVGVLIEEGQPLSLSEARLRQSEGKFTPGNRPALGFGIGSRPVWLHLAVSNPSDRPQIFRLAVGTTWIDKLDVYLVQGDQIRARLQTGDANPNPKGIVPALGYALPLTFPPGLSDIYLRAETLDPLLLPIQLTPDGEVTDSERWLQYCYGVMYGFLTALLAYNLMLYIGLRKLSYLFYALYLASFIATNLAYTGHGFAWWWPEHPQFQRYVIFVAMVLFSCSGLLFAVRFLALADHAPRALRFVKVFVMTGVSLLGLSLLFDNQHAAAVVAFAFVTIFTFTMVTLGAITLQSGRSSGGYFLAAAMCGVIGVATTTLAVLGIIPYNLITYHSVEFGLLAEATLLALALAYQFRDQVKARRKAEYLARHDPLSGLLNRRAFYELVEPSWSIAVRSGRPLSVIMLDIDHFKRVNDQYGHDIGDQVLIEISQLMVQKSRTGDLISRWGGEEFLLVLPETDLQQAYTLAERIRVEIEARTLITRHGRIRISASLGVAERQRQATLDELIAEADIQLYEAKRSGRNKVRPVFELEIVQAAADQAPV